MNLRVVLSAKDNGLQSQLKSVQRQVDTLNSKMVNLNKDVNRSNAIFKGFSSKVGGQFKGLASTIGTQTSKIKNSFTKTFNMAAYVGSFYLLGKALSGAIQASMDAVETQNLFNVSMGNMAVETGKAIDKITELYGLDPTNVRGAVGSFALLARSMSMTTEQAKTLSLGAYNLGMDLSSLMNVDIEQVMHDLKSGLLGQSETVYKYGMDVTEAGIKQEALNQGITKSVRNMSQGEKMALRYAVMIRTASVSNGDFAKTIEQPANQFRILQERLLTLSRSIGNIFIPIIQTVLPYLNAFAAVAIKVAQSIATLVGFVAEGDKNTFGAGVAQDTADAFDDVGGAVSGATNAIKRYKATILGIDELNIMNAPTDDAGGGGGGGGGVGGGASILPEFILPTYDSLTSGVKTKASKIAEAIQSELNEIIALADQGKWEEIGERLATRVNSLIDLEWASELGGKLGNILTNAVRILIGFVSNIDWLGIGRMIASFLNGAINNIDGAVIGRALVLKFNAVFGMLYGFVTTFDWILFGTKIYEGINSAIANIDLLTAIGAITGLISGVLDLLITVLDGVDWTQFAEKLSTALFGAVGSIGGAIDGTGASWSTSVANTIGDSLENEGSSPLAKKLAEFVNSAMKALVELIAGLDGSRVGTSIGNFLVTIIKNIKLIEVLNAIGAIMLVIGNAFKSALATIAEEVFGGFFSWISNEFQLAFRNLGIVLKIIGQKIQSELTVMYEFFKGILTGIFEGTFKSVTDIVDGIKDVFNGIINFITNVFKGNWSAAWNGIVQVFSGIFQTLGGFVTAPINAIIGAINGVIGAMNGLKINIPDWVPYFGGQTLGFNIGSIPYLASGGIVESSTLANIGEAGAEAVIPLKPSLLSKYFSPILGNNTGDYDTIYNAMRDALRDTDLNNDGDINLYIDGIYSTTIEQARRKNMRSGKVVVPVGV